MSMEKYKQQIKKDIKRVMEGRKFDMKAYFPRIFFLFLLNLFAISLFTVFHIEYALQIFLGIFAISAYILFSTFLSLFKENIKNNLPQLFENERIKYGTPIQDFKCTLVFVGNSSLRGFYCRIYIYKKALIVKFCKHCLVIIEGKYIKLEDTFIGYRCEFEKEKSYLQCRLNKKQFDAVNTWIAERREAGSYFI